MDIEIMPPQSEPEEKLIQLIASDVAVMLALASRMAEITQKVSNGEASIEYGQGFHDAALIIAGIKAEALDVPSSLS